MTRAKAEKIRRGIEDKIENTTVDMEYWADFWGFTVDEYDEFLDMAIVASAQEPIILCKNCKHWNELENGTGACRRTMIWVGTNYDDYCNYAEQKESDEE